jgi:hypothetical protein
VIAHDITAITKLDNQLNSLLEALRTNSPNFANQVAVAYVLHNLSNVLENSFTQISRTFENHIVNQTQWHKELLDKMFLEIPFLRPAVLPETLRKMLNDLRGFRHRLVEQWQQQKVEVIEALNLFCHYLLESSSR